MDLEDQYNRSTDALEIRDYLDPIIKGKIQKGRNSSRYSIGPEYRKTTLKDAREIVKYAQQMLNNLAENIYPVKERSRPRKDEEVAHLKTVIENLEMSVASFTDGRDDIVKQAHAEHKLMNQHTREAHEEKGALVEREIIKTMLEEWNRHYAIMSDPRSFHYSMCIEEILDHERFK